MPPEVLIYIQTVKNYFKTNQEARDYFLSGGEEELFFEHLSEISKKNYEKNGDVMLDVDQFELLRKTVSALAVLKKELPDQDPTEKLFIEVPGFGKFCLN